METINSDYISPPNFNNHSSCSNNCYCLLTFKIILVAIIATIVILLLTNDKKEEKEKID